MNRMTPEFFRGCLVGGAVGDALGAAVEFMSLGEIRRHFGHDGIRDFAEAYGRLGAITDDTQMTAYTAHGLINAARHEQATGAWAPVESVHREYLAWLRGQGMVSRHPSFAQATSVLDDVPAFSQRRAPGNTCLSALAGDRMGTLEGPLNDSKGCGGVMRIAPVGLLGREPFDLGCEIAAITHGHPSGYLAAGFLAHTIDGIIGGADLPTALAFALDRLHRCPGHEECLDGLRVALDAADTAPPTPETVETLGEGWVAEEALAIAVFCCLATNDFERAVVLAVNHSGDSDSTGAIAGNIMGALLGEDAIPGRWWSEVEALEEMSAAGEALLDCRASGACGGCP